MPAPIDPDDAAQDAAQAVRRAPRQGSREYAADEVPFFLRVDLRNRVPAMALHELTDGDYQPVSAAAAGTTFVMREPFEFSIDPADLLDEEAPPEDPDTEG